MFRQRHLILILGDIAALALAFWIMVIVRFDGGAIVQTQLSLFGALFLLWLIILFVFDLYTYARINPTPRTVGLMIGAMSINTIIAVLAFYLFPTSGITPKTNLAIVAVLALVFLIVWRRIFYRLFSQTFARRIGIIGTSPISHALRTLITEHPHIGVIAFHTDDHIPTQDIDMLITEDITPDTLVTVSRRLDAQHLSVMQAYQTLFGKVPLLLMTDQSALSLITREKSSLIVFTRITEILVGSFILIISSPILLFAIIAIALEDGMPIFYSQLRVGKDGHVFKLYKLRSMKKDAEKHGVQWATTNDARITRIGRILRKTHIDEIPQMINIIRGDLALIGPRPERPEIVKDLESQIPYYYLRHTVRPGFTGWAQIKFRYARTLDDSREKFEYDLYYLMNNHPVLDIGIAIKTVQIIFTH